MSFVVYKNRFHICFEDVEAWKAAGEPCNACLFKKNPFLQQLP